jgi:hypothetical protein
MWKFCVRTDPEWKHEIKNSIPKNCNENNQDEQIEAEHRNDDETNKAVWISIEMCRIEFSRLLCSKIRNQPRQVSIAAILVK